MQHIRLSVLALAIVASPVAMGAEIKVISAEAVRDALEKGDTDSIKRAYDDLQNKFQEVSADLYKQASANAGPQPGPDMGAGPQARPQEEGPRKDQGDVVDAEFEVVDEDKKK